MLLVGIVTNHTDPKGTNGSIPLNLEIPALPTGLVPPWLEELGVKKGQYMTLSKLPLSRAMKASCISREGRVLICLWLHTFGFQQELAVKMVDKQKVPLRPDDVCKLTGVQRQHFSDVMTKLEEKGLAKCEGSTKARCLLYAWAVPRPVQEPSKLSPSAGTIFFPDCPQELAKILKRYRLSLPELSPSAGTISELEDLAKKAVKAELSLREAVNCHRKQSALNKEERNIDKQKNREGGVKATSSVETPEQPLPFPSPRMVDSTDEPIQPRVRTVNGTVGHAQTRANGTESQSAEVVDQKASQRTDDPGDGRGAKNGNPSDAGPPLSKLAVSRLDGSGNPRSDRAETAITLQDPQREHAWEAFRKIIEACGKPVSVEMAGDCRAEFFQYPLETQQRIVRDALLRAEHVWDKPKFTPSPLKHLQSRDWDRNPVKPRSLPTPTGNSKQQQRDDALRRLMEQSRALDRELGPLR